MTDQSGVQGSPRSWPSDMRAGFGFTAGVIVIGALVIGSCTWLVGRQPVDPVLAFHASPELGLTRAEILDRLGEPRHIEADRWTYVRPRAWSDLVLRLSFDADGRVAQVD